MQHPRLRQWSLALVVALLAAAPALGAGFQLQENGAKAMGTANAFTGTADDPSAVYFNPAAIARYGGMGGMASFVWIDPHGAHETFERDEGMNNERAANRAIVVPSAWGVAAFDLSDTLRLGIGGGMFAPYGLKIDWGRSPHWGGRYRVTNGAIEVLAPTVNAAFEVDVADGVSIAASFGVSVIYGSIELQRNIEFANRLGNPNLGDGAVKIQLDSGEDNLRFNWNAAGMVRLFDNRVRLGVTYRHQIGALTVKGRSYVMNIPVTGNPAIDAQLSAGFDDSQNRTKLTARLPGEVRVGVGVDVMSNLTLNFDWRWTNWSVMKTFILDTQVPALNGTELVFEYRDSHYFGVGAEYRLMTFEEDGLGLAFRLGYGYDETPVPRKLVSPLLPDDDRQLFTLGLGIEPVEGLTIDFAYMGLHFKHFINRNDTEAPATSGLGKYRTWSNLFALSFGLKF